MSNQQVPTASPPLTSRCSPIATLITNLRLLDFDKHDDWPGISAQVFTAKDTPPNQRSRIKCVEWVSYHLYQIWSPEECQNKLQPFFPPLEPLQSINLRASLFRCLNELKKKGILGREVTIRKSMFDECKGETLYELLSAFSTIVVLKLLPSDSMGKTSIVGRLCLAEKVFPKEYPSLLPLAIAHRMSLKTLLGEKRILKARYRDFGNALENKDQDLSKKFDKIVETQEYLDKNPSLESTVERVGRVLDQHWQGDHRLVDVIAQGEEHGLRDTLLDQEFEIVWLAVSSGKFDGDISTSQHGLLEDLEKRVAVQKARLQQWRYFQTDTEKTRVGGGKTIVLPARRPFGSPKSRRYEQRKEKDLIFSPRKSPRKSMWPVCNPIDVAASEGAKESDIKQEAGSLRSMPKGDTLTDEPNPLLAAKSRKPLEFASKGLLANISFGEDNVDSSFSDVLRAEPETRTAKDKKQDLYDHVPQISISNMESSKIDERGTLSNPRKEIHNTIPMPPPGKADEDELLAEQLVASTISALPTPLRHKLSLAERTRQSMTFASASTKIPNEDMLLPIPSTLIQEETTPSVCADPRATLVERTRQSISLVPTKPTRRQSQRMSKIYPTNQFRTPTHQTQKMTLPEELMSPGAGYDSVFKSRPKIALSPTTSPVPDDEGEEILEISDGQADCELKDSPLARLTARAKSRTQLEGDTVGSGNRDCGPK